MTEPRSVLITGCSSGIGRHCAFGLQQRGWRVFASARRQEDVAELRAAGLEDALHLDVREDASIEAALATLLERTGGRLDAVFNNAGYGQPGAVEDLPREALREQFETNLFGAQAVLRAVLPVMRRQGHGRIAQHSSVLGFVALPWRGAYNASKYALEGLTDTLRHELAGSGVRVSLIQTGPVRSRFRANGEVAFRRWIDAEASVHREAYQAVAARLAGSGDAPFTLGPEAVLAKLVHALEHRRPKARYHVTVPTHVFKAMKRLLPSRSLDRLLRAAGG